MQVSRGGEDGVRVDVHDLVADYVWRCIRAERQSPSTFNFEAVLAALAERRDWDAAVSVLQRYASEPAAARFLSTSGQSMLEAQHYDGLLSLVGLAGLQEVMARPASVYLWASALYETGRVEESIAKASAALTLAEHESDQATLGLAAALRTRTLVDQGKAQEAVDCAERFLRCASADMPAASRCELLLAYAAALASAHRKQEANEALEMASSSALTDTQRSREALARLRRFRILLEPLWTGEWAAAVPALGPMLQEQPQTYMVRQTLRGNLSLALVETGRLARAESLLRLVCVRTTHYGRRLWPNAGTHRGRSRRLSKRRVHLRSSACVGRRVRRSR